MKARFHLFASVLAIGAAMALLSVSAIAANLNSNTANVQFNATLNESLTVAVTAGNTVNFTLASNTASNAGSTTSTVTTAWVLKPGRANIAVWAYFGSAAAALNPTAAGNTVTIPSSAVSVQVNGGAFTPCTTVSPFNAAASGMQIGTTSITGVTNLNSSRTDTLAYNIDTTVVPALPADTYTGVLNIQAQATP
ncbi:MAG TPA: hypothetical protein VJ756_06020 [Terriglobales bacterium]|jgi:hypothetical protein|nr:hypothetical protein [Terriglobales bacterium]